MDAGKAIEVSETLANITGDNPSNMNSSELGDVTTVMTQLVKTLQDVNETEGEKVCIPNY